MSSPTGRRFEKATVIGGGVIGLSWTALFLARGLEVVLNDTREDIQQRTTAGLAEIAPTLESLGYDTKELTARLSFEKDLAKAVSEADAVQENGPERLELKRQIWQTVEAAAPSHALLASSTSSIPATLIAQGMQHPERLIVGHPFNPPHLVPLVEVAPGEQTSPETVELARAFYTSLGKNPQVLKKEIPGFVANRLQAALFRECVHLVREGVVTEQELDSVVTSSIGMRWAVAGPFRTFHLGGGPGGLEDFLTHLGPDLEAMWGQLGTPTLDPPTVSELVAQSRNFGGTVEQLAAERDHAEIALMRALGELPSS